MIEILVQKYLLKLLREKAKKDNVPVESVGIMLQTDPRPKSNNKSIIFSQFVVDEIVNYEHQTYLTKEEIIKLIKG